MSQRDPIRAQGDLIIDVEPASPYDHPIQYFSDGTGVSYTAGTNGDFVIRTGDTERGRIRSDGTTSGVFSGLGNITPASPLTTKGDLFGYDTTNDRLPVGADGQTLVADSTQAMGLRWGSAPVENLSLTLAAGNDAGAHTIVNLGAPVNPNDAATKTYADNLPAESLAATLASGANANGIIITNAGTPANQSDVATKGYVDLETVNSQSGASYTAVLSDLGKVIYFTGSSATTFTIPPNSSVAYPTFTNIYVCQMGTGAVTISPGSGVTIVNPYNSFVTAAQYAEVKLTKTNTNTWRLNGEVA